MNTATVGRVPVDGQEPPLPLAAPRGAGGRDPSAGPARGRELFTTRATPRHERRRGRPPRKVSVDTLYASVGRKPQLLLAVHDMALGSSDEPVAAEQRDYVAAMRAATARGPS